jgi:asparagine N-glycosylation enzyme membrane subunit Stt3
MIWLVFGLVVIVMIGAGILISRLAEIAKADRGKKAWIWGVIILIVLIAAPLLLLGIIVKFAQYATVGDVFGNFGDR